MEIKTNIAELLKDCQSGMELDCTMYENVTFEEVVSTIDCDGNEDVNIILLTHYNDGADDAITLTNYGTYTYNETAKCVIFPKGKTTWEGFVPPCKFKDGDIIFTNTNALKCNLENSWVSIFKEYRNNRCACYVCLCLSDLELYHDKWEDELLCELCEIEENRLATEEEKQKLFKAIKDNGYKWNAETKTLEELFKPKFKVGDEIVKRDSISNSWIIHSVSPKFYGLKLPKGSESIGVLPVSEQDDYELVPDIEPKFKVGDRIRHCRVEGSSIYRVVKIEKSKYVVHKDTGEYDYHIDFEVQDDWELVPNKFDINTLKPFNKVLVRGNVGQKWTHDFFGFMDKDKGCPFVCVGHYVIQCIPHKGNEHLLGKTDDCDDYYKTWK